jgi:protein-L-isoaspartate(D-aspartate) O-methyltransferase
MRRRRSHWGWGFRNPASWSIHMSERIYDHEAAGGDLRARLVEELRAGGSIRTIGVATAFSEVQRELFIPEVVAERGLEAVYRDQAYITKEDAQGMPLSSSSQPAMMASMLELLEAAPGHRVLEVGAGTGYNAALLANIVGPYGHVATIDIDPEIAARAQRGLRDAQAPVEVAVGDGRLGLASGAPYDRIIVTASAETIPAAWFAQLADGGRLVVPLRLDPDADAIHLIPAFVRSGDSLRASDCTWGGFMPLHGGQGFSGAPRTSLQATLFSGGRPVLLVSLIGSGLEPLSEAAAKRLIATVLDSAPQTGAEGTSLLIGGHTPAVFIYLMVRIHARRRIWIRHAGREGVGLIDRRGLGAAAITTRSLWSLPGGARRARWRLEAWGQGARAELEQLLADWQTLVHEGRDQLEITALPAGETLEVSFSWAQDPRRRAAARRRASA